MPFELEEQGIARRIQTVMIILLLLLFILLPLVEVYFFIIAGGNIGALGVIGACLLTAALGAVLVRNQGLGLFFKAQEKIRNNQAPAQEMFEGLCILLAALLLLTPGFLTDTIGFLLLIPPVRRFLRDVLLDGLLFGPLTGGWVSVDDIREKTSTAPKNSQNIIDADYEVVEDTKNNT